MAMQEIKSSKQSNNLLIVIVIVIGLAVISYFGFQLLNLKKVDQENLNNQSSGQVIKNINSTVAWNNYTNSRFNYSLKYPLDWYKEEDNLYDPSANPVNQEKNAFTVQFCPNSNKLSTNSAYSGPCLSIQSYPLNSNISLREIAKHDEDATREAFFKLVEESMKDTTINGKAALTYTIDGHKDSQATDPAFIKETLIRDGNNIHDIEFLTDNVDEYTKWQDTYELILNTIEFTDELKNK